VVESVGMTGKRNNITSRQFYPLQFVYHILKMKDMLCWQMIAHKAMKTMSSEERGTARVNVRSV